MGKLVPLTRIGDVEEMARAALFLAGGIAHIVRDRYCMLTEVLRIPDPVPLSATLVQGTIRVLSASPCDLVC